jgi:hypothetical protein
VISQPANLDHDRLQVVEWDWAPTEGGASHTTSTATVESLSAALVEYVRDWDYQCDRF